MTLFAINMTTKLNSGQVNEKRKKVPAAFLNVKRYLVPFALKRLLLPFVFVATFPLSLSLITRAGARIMLPLLAAMVFSAGLCGSCVAAEKQNDRLRLAEKKLSDAAPAVRRGALAELLSLKGTKAVPDLLKALDDSDPSVRGEAVLNLGRLKSGEAVAPLINLLKKDIHAQVRGQAALAIAGIGDLKAVPALVQCLKDKAAGVKGSCIRALGVLKAKEAVVPLANLMAGADAHLKAQALTALGQVGSPEAGGAVRKELENLRAKKASGAHQDQPLLVEEEAIRALGEIGGAGAAPLVKKGLDSPDDRIKAVSCRALVKLGDNSGLSVCLGLLKHSEAGIRKEMALALAESGDASATGAIQEALRVETNPVVRRILESSLEQSGLKR